MTGKLLALLPAAALAVAAPARASLGGTADSVEADRKALGAVRRAAVARAGYTVQEFENIRGLAGKDQVFAQWSVDVKRFCLGHDGEVPALAHLQRDVCEGLEVTGFAGGYLARTLGQSAQLAMPRCIEREHPVRFAVVSMTDDHRLRSK